MSLFLTGFRFGAAVPAVAEVLAGLIPRIPTVGLRIDLRSQTEGDQRLRELKEQIEANDGESPFMIDNGTILKAVPKKKPSYRKTRTKFLASGDKKIKPLENIVRCPACGHVKRSHFMCMNCFGEIKTFLKAKKRELLGEIEVKSPFETMDDIDKRIVYTSKKDNEPLEMKDKSSWIPQREQPMIYSKDHLRKPKRK